MKYKPHLLMNPATGSFKFIYVDSNKVSKTPVIFDNLDKITRTKNSPLKKIEMRNTSRKLPL